MFLHGSTNLNITTIRMISMVNVPKKIGLKKDESGSDVIVLQDYLKRFGYIRPDKQAQFGARVDLQKAVEEPEKGVFDHNTEEALKRFQAFNKLPITGVLDKSTFKLNVKTKMRSS